MQDYAALAKISGFTDAAFLPVRELVVVPEYRRFCEQNLCGNYGVLPACCRRIFLSAFLFARKRITYKIFVKSIVIVTVFVV